MRDTKMNKAQPMPSRVRWEPTHKITIAYMALRWLLIYPLIATKMLIDTFINGFVLFIMATFFPLFPNLSKIYIQAPDSVILLKPNKKTLRILLSIMTTFSQDTLRGTCHPNRISAPSIGTFKYPVRCAQHHNSVWDAVICQ